MHTAATAANDAFRNRAASTFILTAPWDGAIQWFSLALVLPHVDAAGWLL